MKEKIYLDRLKKLKRELKKLKCPSLLIESSTGLYYMTGIEMSAGSLIVNPKGARLLVDARYFEKCQQSSPFPVILSSKSLKEYIKSDTLGFDKENTTYARFEQLKKLKLKLKPVENPVKNLRLIKSPYEIKILRKAAKLGSEGYDFVCSQLKTGITEMELAQELEIFWKKRGGQGLAFEPIIAFGANSSMPHYTVSTTKLKKGNPVLIDIGVTYNHYHSDMTRVVFFGEPHPKMLEIYSIVQKAQKEALKLCRPKTLIGELDGAARDLITSQGYGECFTHSLGHGIGLEVHEYPIIRNKAPYKDLKLEPGMVLTIEPGIYLPGFGGVRIEDTVLITKEGHHNLTKRPKHPKFIKT